MEHQSPVLQRWLSPYCAGALIGAASLCETHLRSARTRPELSATLHILLGQSWVAASLAGDEQIRSIHLLTAMVETSGLKGCDGPGPLIGEALWPVH